MLFEHYYIYSFSKKEFYNPYSCGFDNPWIPGSEVSLTPCKYRKQIRKVSSVM